LEEGLDLKGFVNLEELNCCHNQLTSLDVSNCSKLKELYCRNNQLTNLLANFGQLKKLDCDNNQLTKLDYTKLDPKKLTYLGLISNNLERQDVKIFSEFVNLEDYL